jgi:hypothetical protein
MLPAAGPQRTIRESMVLGFIGRGEIIVQEGNKRLDQHKTMSMASESNCPAREGVELAGDQAPSWTMVEFFSCVFERLTRRGDAGIRALQLSGYRGLSGTGTGKRRATLHDVFETAYPAFVRHSAA